MEAVHPVSNPKCDMPSSEPYRTPTSVQALVQLVSLHCTA